MIEAAAALGYAETSVAHVLSYAGASRSAFYARFTDKHDCFIAALHEVSARVQARACDALGSPETEPCAATVAALVAFASEEPQAARLLFCETLAAGLEARTVRDRLIERLAGAIEAAWESAGSDVPGPDVPARALIAGVFRLLALRLRASLGEVNALGSDLDAWVASYTLDDGPFRWRTALGPTQARLIPAAPKMPSAMPPPLPRGRHGLSAGEVASNRRERLLYGLASAAFQKGYSKTSVADIVAAAKLSREVFYANFADKHQAAAETLQFSFESAMILTAEAFYTGGHWPQRMWMGLEAFDRYFREHPEFAHLVFLEGPEIGPITNPFPRQRIMAFRLLLEEGYSQPSAPELPRTVSEAIASTVAEIGYLQAPHSDGRPVADLLSQSVYMCLSPFIGPGPASELVAAHTAKR